MMTAEPKQDDDQHSPKDAEKQNVGDQDRTGEDDQEGGKSGDDTTGAGPEALIDTLSDPDVDSDPAEEIEENGEPFEGNNA